MLNVVTDNASVGGLAQRRAEHLAERRDVAEAAVDAVLHARSHTSDSGISRRMTDDEQRRQRGQHEREPPADPRRQHVAHHRGEEARERRAALQVRAVAPAHVRRHRLADQRVRHRPFAADADAGDRARDEQRPEADRHPGRERADAVDQDGHHQQRLAAEAIGHRAADEAADRGKGERRAEQHADLAARQREILDQRRRRNQKAEEQQIVEVEDPADEGEARILRWIGRTVAALAEQRHAGAYVKVTATQPMTATTRTWWRAPRWR